MSRRIRVNLTRWLCKTFRHRFHNKGYVAYCLRCGRFW